MRILIADPKPRQRLLLEQRLNAEGCHGIATAKSAEEVMRLMNFGFDLILIEHAMAGSDQSELSRRLLHSERSQHVLRYRSDDREPGEVDVSLRHKTLLLSMAGVPNAPVLRRVIAHVRSSRGD